MSSRINGVPGENRMKPMIPPNMDVPLLGQGPQTPPIFPLTVHAVDPQFPAETHFLAFPIKGRDQQGNEVHGFHTHAVGGLTKREYVATHLLGSILLNNPLGNGETPEFRGGEAYSKADMIAGMVKASIELADMLLVGCAHHGIDNPAEPVKNPE